MFRKKGIIGLILFVILIFAGFYFFTDGWIERKIEKTGTEWNRALVEVDNLHMSLLDLRVSWDRLQVTDPENTMKNSLETGNCEFDLEFAPLLAGKVIVEDFVIKDVVQNSDRETDGKVDFPEEPESSEPGFIESAVSTLESEIADAPVMNLDKLKNKVNTDSILAVLEIKSPKRIDSLKTVVTDKYKEWEKRLLQIDLEKDYKDIESKVKSIDVKKIKNVQEVVKTVNTLREIKQKTESLKKNYLGIKTDLTSDISETLQMKEIAAEWIKSDYQSALAKAKLPDFSAENIGKMLFGQKVVSNLKQYLNYVNIARNYYSDLSSGGSSQEEETAPPRLRGRNVYFYERNAQPDFWLKNIELSGQTASNIALAGKVENVVSDQRLIKRPTEFNFSGTGSDNSSLSIDGLMNYFEGQPQENFAVNYSGFDLSGTNISESSLLPNSIEKGRGELTAALNLKGNSIFGAITFSASNVVFNPTDNNTKASETEKIVQSLIKNIDFVSFKAEISGTQNDIRFSLKSNLDKLFADNLKSMLGEEVNKLRAQLNDKVKSETEKYKNQLYSLIDQKSDKYSGILSKLGVKSDSIKKLLDSKNNELEKKKKELEGNLTKKLIDKIF